MNTAAASLFFLATEAAAGIAARGEFANDVAGLFVGQRRESVKEQL